MARILDFTAFCSFLNYYVLVFCFGVLSNVQLWHGSGLGPYCPFNSWGNCHCLLKSGATRLKLDVKSYTAVIFQSGKYPVSLFVWDLRSACIMQHNHPLYQNPGANVLQKKPSKTIPEQSERDLMPGHTFVYHMSQWVSCILCLVSCNSRSLCLCWLDVQ